MNSGDRIPTPISHRWRRFRYQALPYVVFACTLVLATWLWQQQGRLPNATGMVEGVRLEVATAADGILVHLEPTALKPWSLFDRVEAGQIVARLDEEPIRAAVKTLEAESARIRKEIVAARTRVALEAGSREHDRSREANRLAWQIERRRLDALDRKMQIDVDQIDLERRKEVIAIIEPLVGGALNSFPRLEFIEEQLRRDRVTKRIEDNRRSLEEATAQHRKAIERLREYPEPLQAEVETLLAPVRASLDVQEARINELSVQAQSLLVRAPISGTIAAIHVWPGQAALAGTPIMTIASEHGRHIVSYIRQQQRIEPREGMPVDVRIAGVGHRSFATTILRVGPQIEPIPPQQLRDPKTPEWGLPVQILIPENLNTRPGTQIEVTF